MSLAAGTALGPYEILAPIGAGGMGEVYRARDTRLDRVVAVKVLPPVIASEAARARFEREARAISGLSHPNICALYDVGHHERIEYLVVEYLEGETLADRLSRGALPLSQVVRYGSEIAQALHHAHRRGITHRDLKPGNVMITAAGIKLLDFGLAKLVEAPAGGVGQSETVTRPEPLTAEGTIVGTLPYMSPEHVEGKEVDHRSDIFSLGVILYEMVTGRRPFAGGSQAALIASILAADPPSGAVTSPMLDRVIRTALEKNPEDRWQSAHDLSRELRWISESSGTLVPVPAASKIRVPIVLLLPLLALVAGVGGWAIGRTRSTPATSARLVRASLLIPPDVRMTATGETSPLAISPDGRTVAFTGWAGESTGIFLRSFDSSKLREVPGTGAASGPFWSPDGTWLGYSAKGKLWKIKLPDGTPQSICEVSASGAQASWRGDTILFSDRPGGRPGVYRVSSEGGVPSPVTQVNAVRREARHGWPYLLDDGKHFLYVAMIDESFDRELRIASFDSPSGSLLASGVTFARQAGDRLLFVRDGKLVWQRFQVGKGLLGDPAVLAEDVAFFYPAGTAGFDASANGTVVYATNTVSERLIETGRDGVERRVLETEGAFAFDVSPDRKKVAMTVRTRASSMDIWIYDLVRGLRDRFTSEPGVETYPVWLPDGRGMVYSVASGSPPRLVRRQLSASTAQPIKAPGTFQIAGCISPDGKYLYYVSTDSRTRNDIFRTALDGSNSSVPVMATEANEHAPALSPDGRWLAFVSNASGRFEIYALDLLTSDRFRISASGGYAPRWASNTELVYVTLGNTFVSVTPRVPGRWDEVATVDLFTATADVNDFEVLPGAQSFLIADWKSGASDAHIHVVTGW